MAVALTQDPRDSEFNSGVAQLLFNTQNQRTDLTQQGAAATEDFNTMLARMADQRAQDLLAQNYAANKQGLFYSGQLTKRRGDVDKGYDQQQSDAQTAYNRAATARQQALDRLGTVTADASSPLGYSATGQAGLDLSSLYNGAVSRAQAAAQDAADRAAAATAAQPQAALAPTQAAPAATPKAYQTVSAPGGVWHIYPNGRRVFVKK
jgi:hypothetical protein